MKFLYNNYKLELVKNNQLDERVSRTRSSQKTVRLLKICWYFFRKYEYKYKKVNFWSFKILEYKKFILKVDRKKIKILYSMNLLNWKNGWINSVIKTLIKCFNY